MSFEGYYQVICEKGHTYNKNVYEVHDWAEEKCVFCKSKIAWFNTVDLTNGSFIGSKRIDGYIELKIDKPTKECECEKCGNIHTTEPATYKIPKKKGHVV
jgi:nucleoside-specific outer membrane channel protein Tsx